MWESSIQTQSHVRLCHLRILLNLYLLYGIISHHQRSKPFSNVCIISICAHYRKHIHMYCICVWNELTREPGPVIYTAAVALEANALDITGTDIGHFPTIFIDGSGNCTIAGTSNYDITSLLWTASFVCQYYIRASGSLTVNGYTLNLAISSASLFIHSFFAYSILSYLSTHHCMIKIVVVLRRMHNFRLSIFSRKFRDTHLTCQKLQSRDLHSPHCK